MAKKVKYNSIPRNGLIGEWLLNGNALDTNDGIKNNGTATNVTYVSTDKGYQKQAGSFNGSSSYIGSITSSGISLTIFNKSAWFYTGSTTTQGITSGSNTSKSPNINLVTGKITLARQNEASLIESTNNYPLNKWVFVSINYTQSGSNGILELYINGILDKTNIITNTFNSYGNFQIGRYATYGYFNGQIQGVRIYNRVLSTNEIQNLYLEGLRRLGGGGDNILSSAVAYYDFNGNANDIVGGNNGTVTGATLTTDRFGIANRAYSFDGVNDYISATHTLGTGNLTFSYVGWIYVTGTQTRGEIVWISNATLSNAGLGFSIRVKSGGNDAVYFDYAVNAGSSTVARVNYNSWNFISVTKTGDNIVIGVNGVNESFTKTGLNATGNTISFGDYIVFGAPSSNAWFNGKIDDIIIFNKSLSADEVKQLYELSKTKYLYPFKKTLPLNLKNGLVFWGAGNTSGTTYYDVSGSGNNGTMVNSPTISRIGQHNQISLNGTNQYADLGNVTQTNFGTGDFTINCWFIPQGSGDRGLINKVNSSDTNGFSFHILNSGKLQCFTVSGGIYRDIIGATTLGNGKYYMGTVIRRSGTLEIYINSFNDYGSSPSGISGARDINNTYNLEIGRLRNQDTRYMNGTISNPMIWNRALTKTEIQALYYSLYIQ